MVIKKKVNLDFILLEMINYVCLIDWYIVDISIKLVYYDSDVII